MKTARIRHRPPVAGAAVQVAVGKVFVGALAAFVLLLDRHAASRECHTSASRMSIIE